MKLLEIALFLFNIFEFAISAEKLIPRKVEIVLKQYADPLTGEVQKEMYEKRYNYLAEGEKYPLPEKHLSDKDSLQKIVDDLNEAAEKIVDPNPDHNKDQAGGFKLKAHKPEFTVTYTDLTVEQLQNLLEKQPYPRRISGKVEIWPNTDSPGKAAAAAAKPPAPPRDNVARNQPPSKQATEGAGDGKGAGDAAPPPSTHGHPYILNTMPEAEEQEPKRDYVRVSPECDGADCTE